MPLQRLFWPLASLVLLVAGILEIRSALGETQTWDEGIHISAGYAYVSRGDYSWNVEHPPLVKIFCALPLRLLRLDAHPYGADGKRKSQIEYGIDFLYGNKRHADTILIAARGVNIVLSLGFLAALAWWVRRRFGVEPALLALALCAFDPNLIAHARYITTDVPLTACYFFACVLWMEYLESGGLRRLLLAAAAIGIAMVVKFSAVLLAAPLALLYAIRWVQRPKEFPVWRVAIAAGAVIAAAVLCIGVVYWPETVRWWNANGAPAPGVPGIENDIGPLAVAARKLHVEGHSYVIGLNQVVGHNEGGHASYLMGVRSDKGWWYYFPVVFAVKSTMAALIAALIVLAAGVRAAIRGPRKIPFVAWGLALPPLTYFGLSMTSAINLGMRHILPVYPFLYVGVAAVLAGLPWRRIATGAMIALGVLQTGECASITPDYLAFFNALAGGPGRGPEYLVDSNIDWGQDVKKLVHWLDAHGTRRARVYYFGNTQLRYYGINEAGYPDPLDEKGWDAIDDYCVANVTPLNGVYAPLAALAPLRMREPIAKVGWSMYVYDLRKHK